MSTPTTTTSPPQPTGSSNPISLKFWWEVISNWINLMSPDGATSYDSGWVAVATSAGMTGSSPQVRRIGKLVIFRGTIGGTFGANVTTEIGSVPTGFTPSSQVAAGIGTTGGQVVWGNVNTAGAMRIRDAAGGAKTVYLSALSYTVD